MRLPLEHKRGGKLIYAINYFAFIVASFAVLSFRSLKKKYDVVHVHNMPDVLVFSSIVAKMLGSKVILDLHDPMPELMQTIYGIKESSKSVRLLKFLEKVSLGFSDCVITVNETCKKIFSARSCPLSKVTVIMNVVDEKIFSIKQPEGDRETGNEKFVIMYHGSLVERNGLGLAVEAMSRIDKSLLDKIELRVYGCDTEFLQESLELAKKCGIEDSVVYMGPKRVEEIVQAIDECDIGIIPNLRNIFTLLNTPTRIFEFLSRGKPVIAPSAPGILEYFSADSLVMFELGDVEDLARKLEFAFRNRSELHEITCRGQEIILEHRWSNERSRFLDLVGLQLGMLKKEQKEALASSQAEVY